MGIFRAGKRVGPFDIRVGFPRDRSLDQVDKDPRLKQRANRENTIGRMQANIARSEGYARAARFAIKLFFPTQLKDLIKEYNSITKLNPTKSTDFIKIKDLKII